MTLVLPQATQKRVRTRFEASALVLAVIGFFLCVLVLLPLGWLGWYSITDTKGALTLGNFVTLVTDPTFVAPLLTALIIATSVSVAACAVALPLAWLVARTDLPARGAIRAL